MNRRPARRAFTATSPAVGASEGALYAIFSAIETRQASRRTRSSRCARSYSAGRRPTESPPSVWVCRPAATGPLCSGNIARNTVTPTSATTRGRNLRIFASSRVRPRNVFFRPTACRCRALRARMMLVTPKPHSGSRSSSCERDALGNEPRFVQQLPEPVGETREVMAGQRRSHAGVDADKQHVDARPDPIRAVRRQRSL